MSDAAALIARIQAQRSSWCELESGKAVQLRRPAEVDVILMMQNIKPGVKALQVELQHVCAAAVGWRGFTEEDLLGKGIGVQDEVPFDAGVWAEVVADRAEWLKKAAEHLLTAITTHFDAKDAAAKNSGATSLPGTATAANP